MPSITREVLAPRVTKFTNCRVPSGQKLIEQDLWVDSISGKILQGQRAFYEDKVCPDQVINLGGRILAPGFIDVQINGANGFDFSVPQPTKKMFDDGLRDAAQTLVKMGVTSYLPTVTSQSKEVYPKVLPSLGPSGHRRRAEDGAESLGAHVEGPFLSPGKNGIHNPEVLIAANDVNDLIQCYGLVNFCKNQTPPDRMPIKMITAAPEVGNMLSLIPVIQSQNILYSIGHSDATYEQAMAAVSNGATMITHMFNAMRPFYHRHPGIFGLLGQFEQHRPYYGIIADGIHLHPTSIQIAYNAHPAGMILVTDAMKLCGMPDGVYEWTNGDQIVKKGAMLTLEGSEKLAGSSATLIECVNNFRRWAGAKTVEAIAAVTETPAKMLGIFDRKGTLAPGADADLVVLGEDRPADGDMGTLTVDQVWKFGVKVFDKEKA
ncbi:N-acetylglucosamine-6-phosphate deacetylase [Trichophyton rubrum D6]|uniref:N-acetylglucosamine-6-phosphate deacetylase n=3 Tax=Trichophyton TaxID=5550 RepID=F2SJL6_TRIRC|nr:N-acetylglucosamine-6-phosphate deacetylase [Trichophyton rubrum CBS 118892]EZF17208.1 N-acetylglucosamine-6-phosphate deacetylase [Trichophyton rubrum MR850]EZF40617.1 N-acetylglucosamine-6-phosphate deacetylase [Trichophyton rubrum CBS 100081]EZF50816.1 N-acetylglucosamine-6-phosphate deacetylase [Trichophyton rubrum CBS 288.86]EZF61811.1 N-acetylglucosamine-6-phosphate deacetylase [Trichophyton rubrum CBS 289.86]EZF72469.1 N-acetylglucosamine-6-phosphate deacetylase [Trichophyton soudane